MEWTKEDSKQLREWRERIDSDNIRVKEMVKKRLMNNRDIIKVLANETLEEKDANPDQYFGRNIYPCYMIPGTQSKVKNFICFETGYENRKFSTDVYSKLQQLIFYILCDEKNIIDKSTGLARHDLLSALIIDEFNWEQVGGVNLILISNKPGAVDKNYVSRTLVFQWETHNNVIKMRGGNPTLINKIPRPGESP